MLLTKKFVIGWLKPNTYGSYW